MDIRNNKSIDDYIQDGNDAYNEVVKTMAKLNLFEYLKQTRNSYDNRNKVQHRR